MSKKEKVNLAARTAVFQESDGTLWRWNPNALYTTTEPTPDQLVAIEMLRAAMGEDGNADIPGVGWMSPMSSGRVGYVIDPKFKRSDQ